MTTSVAVPESPSTAVATAAPALPEAVTRRGLDEPQWRTLMNSLFPGAKAESVLMVVDYCKARRLDPMKKPCHIVPMKVKDAKTGEWGWRDVVMPGIYEYRTTAMRTGLYQGHSAPEYGPMVEAFGVTAPEWCAMTMFRHSNHGEKIAFPVRVYFNEVCATNKEGKANDRWAKAPIQMLTKCAEAAGLREAFPDEFGGEPTAEEMDGRDQVVDITPTAAPVKAALRVSQQPQLAGAVTEHQPIDIKAQVEAVAAEIEKVTEPKPAPAAKANVGVIVDVLDKSPSPEQPAAAIVLNTGFVAATTKPEFIAAAVANRDKKAIVELVTRPSKDPSRFAPALTEIIVVESGEATS